MRLKKMILAFCLAVGLTLAVPTVSATLGMPDTMSTVSAAEGWNTDENGTYYMQGDSRLLGFQDNIGGDSYYFDQNGYRVDGPVQMGSSIYLFHPETGKLCTGLSGLKQIGSDTSTLYYFTSGRDGRISAKKWIKTKSKYYYANEKGEIKLGTIKVGKKLYHITRSGRLTSYKRSSYDQKYYYATSKGVLNTGLQKIKNKTYYFNPTTGARQTGKVKVGKYTYYFSTKDGASRTGWIKGKGKYYYYSSSGRKATGFKTINKKRYYLDPENDGARVQNSWKKIGKYYYYFNSKGVLQTGLFKVDGKLYYTNSKGIRKTGWQTVSGRKYYMDKKTGAAKTGWFTYSGKKYYLNPLNSSSTYGAAKIGFHKISGKWYYFNDNGTMRTGWLTRDAKFYYFDKTTGQMYTGVHVIDGNKYDFGTSGAYSKPLSGAWRIEVNRKKCFIAVYRGDTPIKAFVCSTARPGCTTPTGTFYTYGYKRWHELDGPTWGQYCINITQNILFHSVPNTRYNDNHSLNASAYNKLGTPASAGCIRLTVAHAKWLFDNVPPGSKIVISDSIATPKNVVIEKAQKIPLTQNYDPTDPYA